MDSDKEKLDGSFVRYYENGDSWQGLLLLIHSSEERDYFDYDTGEVKGTETVIDGWLFRPEHDGCRWVDEVSNVADTDMTERWVPL